MARRTHYSKGYLSKIETGAKRPTVDVARLCDEVLRADGRLLGLLTRPAPPDGGTGAPADPPGGRQDAGCPYRGLLPFTPRDAKWFFGRERATAALVERVFERIGSGPLVLVAPSGAGKSSLLNAGFIPALARGDLPMAGAGRWPVVTLTPASRPLDELLERTAKVLGGGLGVTVEEVRDDPVALLAAVAARSDAAAPAAGGPLPPSRPVLIVDQFEELFTDCPDEEERRAFVRVLATLAGPAPAPGAPEPAVVVLGVRADFTGDCLRIPELADAFTDGLFVLPPMSVAELRESVTRPAELAGVTLESGLVPLVLRDAGLGGAPAATSVPQHAGEGSEGTSDLALPLISHALLATWERRRGSALTVDGYERAGGIRGAVTRTAETVFTGLYPAEQRTIRRVLTRLVHVADGAGATRRRMDRTALLEQFTDADGAATALDAFVRARLVTVDSDTVQITHEALLHAWPRLRDWLRADRAELLAHQQLSHAAAEWEREGRDPSALYRGARLDGVRAWLEDPDGGRRLSPCERAFLRASLREEGRLRALERRHVRLRQSLCAALGLLLAFAVTAGALAYQQRGAALDQERAARSRALAAQSAYLAGGQPEASMVLAEEAYRLAATAEARGALLSTQAQPFSARLGGHTGPVNTVAFAPDGLFLATAGSDGRVILRRTGDHRTTAVFTVPGRVRSVAFSPDGRVLAATSTGGPVHLWPASGRGTRTVLPGGTKGARAVAFDPRGSRLAVAAADGTVQVWDPARPHRPVAPLTGHAGNVNALAYSPDGRTLVSAGADRTVRLWDTDRAGPPVVLRGHADEVLSVVVSPNGRQIASGSVDRTVRLWDVPGRRLLATLTGSSDDVNAVAYMPGGSTVVSGSGDGTTRLWDVRRGTSTTTLAGHTDYVLGVAVNATGTTLATAGFDQSVVVWDLGGPVLPARPFTEVWTTAYSPDGGLLATANADRTVRLWDVARRRQVAALAGHDEAVFSVAFAPDGRMLASGSSDGTVRLWDVPRRRLVKTLTGHTGEVFSVAFAPDGRLLASGGADRTVRLWDVPRRRLVRTLTGHADYVNRVVFSPDGRTLVSAGDDLSIRLWDVAGRRPTAVLTGHTGAVRGLAFNSDGRLLASSGNDGSVRLWDVAGRRPTAVLTGHTGAVRGLAFNSDGRTLASSGNDGSVRLWDVAGRRPTAVLTGHTGAVRGLAFSPDGRLLASSGNDRTVRLWDLPGRRHWATLTGHADAVWGVAFAPDGRSLASGSTDGTVRLWDLDPGARLARICLLRERAPRERPPPAVRDPPAAGDPLRAGLRSAAAPRPYGVSPRVSRRPSGRATGTHSTGRAPVGMLLPTTHFRRKDPHVPAEQPRPRVPRATRSSPPGVGAGRGAGARGRPHRRGGRRGRLPPPGAGRVGGGRTGRRRRLRPGRRRRLVHLGRRPRPAAGPDVRPGRPDRPGQRTRPRAPRVRLLRPGPVRLRGGRPARTSSTASPASSTTRTVPPSGSPPPRASRRSSPATCWRGGPRRTSTTSPSTWAAGRWSKPGSPGPV
ncbi:DNA-binding protein [Streptomyces somaliensis]|nr:DNA-binding protein [Streptomyces somaliensis]